ncbi:3-phosphoshikimate 1-carboxyvinyltransferase [Syntrophomonas zehnderi OL-4]|uniref:3-phosphoshikimate 1-carboxyvinyltransferase n=1 Tax=Syntrophomonas zehnderi OL-4 TaxID=690567 RepID=A0A0E4GCA5_9FIRM|nr:3-phosphoshikimate 1-carboxyvinyltransferase [Syntrophomonas zehnderi]CFY08766.1 3-phosphoshikimate 1-carboxyvinyltransferase [Syntrophomonas zehnderi OL-4]
MNLSIKKIKPFQAVIRVPGDKSISHRSVMIGSIANGITTVENFLPGEDCLSTVNCMRQLGVEIEALSPTALKIKGRGLHGLKEAGDYLDVGNSGTTIRLLSGLLAGQDFFSIITGDASIRRRPMARVAVPLRQMGAQIWGRDQDRLAPLAIKGEPLKAIHYQSPVASAQVKSAILLAGLYADGETSVTEPALSRDHTERMLAGFKGKIQVDGFTTVVSPGELTGQQVVIPGDISSAAFFLAAAAIIPGSRITIQDMGLNPTRTGILEVLAAMGAQIKIENERTVSGEILGDVSVVGQSLKAVEIGGDLIPRLIDEIPVLAVVGAMAEGQTVIRDAGELKVKESNRLRAMATELSRFGAEIRETEDGLLIKGAGKYKGAVCESYHDHRIAMACALMGLAADGTTEVKNSECINISFPGFLDCLAQLGGMERC